MEAIDQLLANNAQYVAGRTDSTVLPQGSQKQLAVVCCMDSRIFLSYVLGLQEGDAFLIRTAGAVVTADVLYSLTIAVWQFAVREILVLGHDGCGLAGLNEQELFVTITKATGMPPDLPFRAFQNVEESVRESVAHVRQYSLFQHCSVRGAVLAMDTGAVREIVTHPDRAESIRRI